MAELTVSVAKAIAGGQGATWWEVYQLAHHFLRQHGEDAPPFSYPAAAPPAEAPAERGDGFPFVAERGPTGKPTGYLLRKGGVAAQRDYDLFVSNVRSALGKHYDEEAGLVCSIALLVAELDKSTPRVTGGREVTVCLVGDRYGNGCFVELQLEAPKDVTFKIGDKLILQAATGGADHV